MKYLVFLLLLIASQVEAANTWWVNKAGNDSRSCQNSPTPLANPANSKGTIAGGIACIVSNGGPGDTVMVQAGTYTERISGGVNITTAVSGSSWATATTIQSYSSDVVTLNDPSGCIQLSTPSAGNAFQYIIFKGFVCDGTTSSRTPPIVGGGVSLGGGQNGGLVRFIKLDSLEMKNWPLTAVIMGGSSANDGNDLWATNMYIHDNGTPAGIIDGNGPGTGPAYGHCFYVEGGPRTLIENSRCINQASMGIQAYATGQGDNNIYRYNWFENTGMGDGRAAFCFTLQSGVNAQIYGNLCFNSQGGMDIATSGHTIYNNTFYGNGIGHGGPGCCYEVIHDTVGGNTYYSSIYFGNAINSLLLSGSTSTFSTTSDPSFVSASGKNFRLSSNSSIAYNTGDPNNANCPPLDLVGTVRPQAGRCDMGAYEFLNLVPPPTVVITSPTSNPTVTVSTATINLGGTSSLP